MYTKPPEKYFKENPTEISLNPLPSHIKDVNENLISLDLLIEH
ncbi:1340_t:CDS:2 [Racocetra fulgida]|uniref:1340_t:CDS:1 n=1 Tax=Racocetra fulgida TaxID=60492 RepID=A0A9N8WHR0_9GLOM|nr:1340_t:CDS:2 [Racocetra fulgida]